MHFQYLHLIFPVWHANILRKKSVDGDYSKFNDIMPKIAKLHCILLSHIKRERKCKSRGQQSRLFTTPIKTILESEWWIECIIKQSERYPKHIAAPLVYNPMQTKLLFTLENIGKTPSFASRYKNHKYYRID